MKSFNPWDEIAKELDVKYGAGKWHCDDIWAASAGPECLIQYLEIARAPAVAQLEMPEPILFAKYEGKPVRVVMASRFGDVGITSNLKAAHGYDKRIYLPELTDFSANPQ